MEARLAMADDWLASHRKHVIVLSKSGKPVFSRHDYGDSGLAMCALLRGLCAKTKDRLRCMSVGKKLMVVVNKPQLILVCLADSEEPVECVRLRSCSGIASASLSLVDPNQCN